MSALPTSTLDGHTGNLTKGPSEQAISAQSPLSSRKTSIGALIALGLLLTVFPFVAPNDYVMNLLVSVLIWMGLSLSWNVFSGYTGYLSIGHTAFFGIGAYGGALSMDQVGFPAALIVGAFAAGAAGLVLGLTTLRLRGLYFTLATVALAESLRILTLGWQSFTGGAGGVIVTDFKDVSVLYVVGALGIVALLGLNIALLSTRVGLRLIAIRDDEDILAACGVQVDSYKVLGFASSAIAAGFFGALYAWQIGYIDPTSVYSLTVSLTVVIMVFLGGVGTLWGPAVGAIVLALTKELLWARSALLNDMYLGVVLIVIVLFLPQGLVGSLKKKASLQSSHFL